MMKRVWAVLLAAILCASWAFAEESAQPPVIPQSEGAYSLPDAQIVPFEGGAKYAVYSGPGESYVREAGGRALADTDDWIQVFGEENGFLLIQYALSAQQMRIGYVKSCALPESAQSLIASLSFAYLPASVTRDAAMTSDPLCGQSVSRELPQGQEGVLFLATMGTWAYVEVSDGAEMQRGFVPSECILTQ